MELYYWFFLTNSFYSQCGTTQVEVDASGSLTYPTQKVDAGGDQGKFFLIKKFIYHYGFLLVKFF